VEAGRTGDGAGVVGAAERGLLAPDSTETSVVGMMGADAATGTGTGSGAESRERQKSLYAALDRSSKYAVPLSQAFRKS
jgi:hypothetical protein